MKLQKDLVSIAKSLVKVTERLDKISLAVEKEAAPAKPAKKTVKKKAAPKVAKKVILRKKAKKAAPKTAAPKKPSDGGILDNIYKLVSGSDGITVAEIKNKTGLAQRQVNNALYKLKVKGKIESIKRGVYGKA